MGYHRPLPREAPPETLGQAKGTAGNKKESFPFLGHALDRGSSRVKVVGVKENMPEISVVDKGFDRLGEGDKVARISAKGTREFLNECSGNGNEDSRPDRGRGTTTTLESTKNPSIEIRK
jgi:hypothetical protein